MRDSAEGKQNEKKNNNNNISCIHNSIMKYVSNRVHAHIKLYKYNMYVLEKT